ncbi:hypothetical protein C1H57_08160 [Clostridium sp. 2-1]|uniref:hypothetical protein n=1 Tax=Clostridium TaxID=1485 RepID=UPI0004259162|nr:MULTISPECIES: hypothetical protein [Clostridium]MBN7575380.1 hypothetical protein [Clostridium beijerinckii]MBN7580691.1 hypothetical protein [Clostridium beijerinckii]MBN7585144.1 hypothetical protein [Clostridium beijerinckii]MBO0522526.1 hypothetical protein [Clostridium beijerinckii]POO91786.1 hypothetical protein C1H57_08160 [Clostridium sp. 2-1]
MKKVLQLNELDQVKNGNEVLDCSRNNDTYWEELLKYIDDKIQNKDSLYMMDRYYDEILFG